jgi:MraZ protein
MFVGEYICKLDSKGRVLLPSALLRQMPIEDRERFVLKKDIYTKCLVLYPASEWDRQNALLKKRLNPFNRKHAEFLREFYRGTAEVLLDGSNRMLIPRRLVEYMGEKSKELIFAGQDGKIEIWDKLAYDKAQTSDADFQQLADDILGGDFLINEE